MRGLRSTIVLAVVLLGLGAYIYFYLAKKPDTTESGPPKQKVFANVQADKIDEVRVKAASGDTTTLKKSGDGWQLAAPIAAKADESEVSGITSNLASLETQRVVEEDPKNLKDFGLDPPRVDIAFKAAGDKDYRHLLLGDKTATGVDLYAKTGADKRVVLVPSFTENSFNRTTFDLRDKTALKFERDKVDGIAVTADGKTLQLTKDGDWKLAKPVLVAADYGSVEGLIGRLQTLQMKSIVTSEATPADLKKYGLDKPQASATLDMGSARATLEIGGDGPDNTLYARDASKPTVMTIEKALLDDLKKGADEYRRKDVFEFRAFNATRFEITRDGQTVAFEKTKAGTGANAPDQWKRVSPNPANADKDKIDAMLTRWANMRASAFVDASVKAGMDKPAGIVIVKFDDGKKEEKVTFGKVDKDVYAARPGEPGAMKIDASDFNEAIKAVDEIAK